MIVKTQIRIEVTPEEFELITRLARESGTSRTRYLIDCATNGNIKPSERVKPVKQVNVPKIDKVQPEERKQEKPKQTFGLPKSLSAR